MLQISQISPGVQNLWRIFGVQMVRTHWRVQITKISSEDICKVSSNLLHLSDVAIVRPLQRGVQICLPLEPVQLLLKCLQSSLLSPPCMARAVVIMGQESRAALQWSRVMQPPHLGIE